MRRLRIAVLVATVVVTACSGDGSQTASVTVTSSGSDEPTTSAATTSAAGTTTTATVAASTSTTEPAQTTTTSTTGVPAEPGGGYACPDLYGEVDDPERSDAMLEAWALPRAEPMWQIPLGSRVPAWAAWSDEVILGFADGRLVGLDVASCEEAWSLTVQGGIDQLAVTEQGLVIVVNGGTIATFSGAGFGTWRHQAIDSVFRFVGENNGVHVFADQFGDLIGFDTGGEVIFRWGGASDPVAVAVSESFVYRATGAEIAARPVAGGEVVWANEIAGGTALFTVPGLLIAQDAESLHAFRPQDGELLWSMPFAGTVAGPMVRDHGEIHVSARHETLGFDTMWHLDPDDGSVIFRADAATGTEWFPEMDDALVLEVGDDGTVTAVDLLQRSLWTIETGANRVDRFTEAELARGGVVVTLSYSAERF